MLGFSINTLTLFGMVLAIGIVVDDAIVVLENIERLMETKNMEPIPAAIESMREVSAPLIAIVLVLISVFIPVTFLSGFTGILMKQFAITITISTLLSGFVALTLTPTLCALILSKNDNKHNSKLAQIIQPFFVKFNNLFNIILNGYRVIITFLIHHLRLVVAIWIAVIVATITMFSYIPSSLIPLEDLGYFYMVQNVNSAGSMQYNITKALSLADTIAHNPMVNNFIVLGGFDIADNGTSKTSATTFHVTLKPYNQRTKDSDVNHIIDWANKLYAKEKLINGFAFNPLPIRGLSPTGGVTFYLQANIPTTPKEIAIDSKKLNKYLMQHYPKYIKSTKQFYDTNTPELQINVDPQKAYSYGLTYNQIFNALQSVFGTYYINFFNKWENLWWVIVQADYKYRHNIDDLNTIYIRNKNNVVVPLGSVITSSYANHTEVVTRFNDFTASQIIVNPTSGHTSGQIMDIIRHAVPQVLGTRYTISWFGTAYQENIAGNTTALALVFGLIMVYLILSALYQLWSLPLIIFMSLPFAMFGAALGLLIFRMPNDLYFQVSLLTLIGLSAKNVILIVEFAITLVRDENMSFTQAAIQAAQIRFRPIIMTSLAFIFGSLPLVLSNGAGANAQHAVGLGIISGMLGSTCISILFVPAFFCIIMNIFKKSEAKEQMLIKLRKQYKA
jgi:hydrophobe/amphiphile efflux-1 (HAE1) family protein